MDAPDRRRARRQRVLKDGKIVTMNYCSVVDCSVRDLSAAGAKIKCFDQAAVPNDFRLVMPCDNSIREARVVWRRADHVGVAFTSEARPAPPRKW
jgi:hypothetical protein